MTIVTREMITAAHGVTLESGGVDGNAAGGGLGEGNLVRVQMKKAFDVKHPSAVRSVKW